MHSRRVSKPEAMLVAYVSPGWLIFGCLGAMLAPSWLQLGHLGPGTLLCHLDSNLAILARHWLSLEPS